MRPKTVAEVAQLALDGERFDLWPVNFLDEIYVARNVDSEWAG
jgi:hypothetical protein